MCLAHAGPCIRHRRIIMLPVLVIFKRRIGNNSNTTVSILHIFFVDDGPHRSSTTDQQNIDYYIITRMSARINFYQE